MKSVMLTKRLSSANPTLMKKDVAGKTGRAIGLGTLMCVSLSGCITLKAPEKPIEINLNINIKQEVVYRLDGEAKNLIKQEAGIF